MWNGNASNVWNVPRARGLQRNGQGWARHLSHTTFLLCSDLRNETSVVVVDLTFVRFCERLLKRNVNNHQILQFAANSTKYHLSEDELLAIPAANSTAHLQTDNIWWNLQQIVTFSNGLHFVWANFSQNFTIFCKLADKPIFSKFLWISDACFSTSWSGAGSTWPPQSIFCDK